jgi:hypothetical protein
MFFALKRRREVIRGINPEGLPALHSRHHLHHGTPSAALALRNNSYYPLTPPDPKNLE